MANEIRILCLNDDNHSSKFYSEDKTIDMSAPEFIAFLAQAHNINYRVRSVYICDLPPIDYTSNEPDLFELAFDTVDCGCAHMTYQEAFDILWAVSADYIHL